MTKKLLPMLVLVCFLATNTSAQTGSIAGPEPQPIAQVDEFIASLAANTATFRASNNTASHVRSLIQDSHPAAYVQGGNLKLYGNNPVALYTNLASLSAVSSVPGLPKANIEIITIRVGQASELAGGINIASLSGFPSLKYIYIISEGNAGSSQIVSAVQNNNPQYAVFYKIAQPN